MPEEARLNVLEIQIRRLCLATFLLNISATVSAQTITEYAVPTAPGSPNGITVGPDGALWFTEGVANKIGRITTAGVFTMFPVPAWPSPYSLPPCPQVPVDCNKGGYSIVNGPDGALWFAEVVGGGNSEIAMGAIGRITTEGAVAEYPVSAPAYGIAAGPDGALWFTEYNTISETGTIGRITTGGSVSEYSPASSNSASLGPFGITSGPDGALWFTDNGVGVWRITTAFVATEYQLPTTAAPNRITSGPDGALWFTDNNGAIWRITTAGGLNKYPCLSSCISPFAITSGPDGALWFTDVAANKIGRITTEGVITEYPIPTPYSNPYSIVSGPDGALWFTESDANKIGRFAVPSAVPVVASISNAASSATGAIAPGELVTIKGVGLGPQIGISYSLDPTTGRVDTKLGGTQVFFGGIAAPILYAAESQINAIVPYEISGLSQLAMQVLSQGILSSATTLQVTSAAPGFFTFGETGIGQAVAFYDDGSLNSPSNPARAGSSLSIYFTGGGQTSPAGTTGSVNGSVLKYLTQSVSATIGDQPATVTFAGAAPSLVDGIGQLNIRVEDNTPSGAQPLVITIGGVSSPATATVAVF